MMVSRAEVRRLLGDLRDEKLAGILKLAPTRREIELAALCLSGRTDILIGDGCHLSATAAEILKVVLSDDAALGLER